MAFVTGSRAYGTPREDSDVDLVVMVSPQDIDRIMGAVIDSGDDDGDIVEYPDGNNALVLRFGPINLLCVTDADDYRVWREGTDELKARKPVTRDEAVALFKFKRETLRIARAAGADPVPHAGKCLPAPAPMEALT